VSFSTTLARFKTCKIVVVRLGIKDYSEKAIPKSPRFFILKGKFRKQFTRKKVGAS